MSRKKYEAAIEAILFTMGGSVELGKIAEALELEKDETKKIIDGMMRRCGDASSGVQIIELDGAYQMCTKAELYEYLIRIARQPKRHVLTDVLLETLSIIAYKQPVTKMEIEKIRGVSSDHAVNRLVEYNLRRGGWMRRGGLFCSERRRIFCEVSACSRSTSFRSQAGYRWKSSGRKRRQR